MRHEQLANKDSFDVVDPATLAEADIVPARPESAVPDVPGSVGVMLASVYVVIIGFLAVTVASAGKAPMMIAVDLAFLAAFVAVPVIFLNLESDPARRPDLARFLAQGMQTYTGHVSGAGALAQMFMVPVLLALGVLAIGIIAMVGA